VALAGNQTSAGTPPEGRQEPQEEIFEWLQVAGTKCNEFQLLSGPWAGLLVREWMGAASIYRQQCSIPTNKNP
jgi:hypothetical protein